MKKQYSGFEVEIFLYDEEDVIRTSGQEDFTQDNTKGYSDWMPGEWQD